MAYSIPVEFYEILEEKVGREVASKLVKVLEESIKNSMDENLERQKIIISEELKRELASKYDIELLRKELENKIDRLETKLENKINKVEAEITIVRKDVEVVRKELRFMFMLLAVIVLAVNQNALEFIAKIFGFIK